MRRGNKFIKFFPAIAFGVAAAFFAGCENARTERSAEIFAAQITVVVLDLPEEKAAAAVGEVFAYMEGMSRRFHAWQPGELAGVNRAVAENKLPLTVGAEMAAMLSLAADAARRSEGLFNPAAGKLFALWGFHSDTPANKPPSDDAIAEYLRAAPDSREIEMRGRVLASAPASARFDFGALAKGAALDAAKTILKQHGVQNALINVGGNIMALGKNGGRPWRVLLNLGGAQKLIELQDGEAAATSGGTERYFVYEGKRYQHIFDTSTGKPAEKVWAASAVSNDAENAGAISDAAATALVVAEEDAAKRIAENFGLAAAVRAAPEGGVSVLIGGERLR